jgi:hypothetical protein
MKDASWRLNRLRRKVYRKTPVGTESSSGSTALALSRSFTKKGFRAWCYEFGFSGGLTHTVTIVGADGLLRIHDAFFNLCYRPENGDSGQENLCPGPQFRGRNGAPLARGGEFWVVTVVSCEADPLPPPRRVAIDRLL